MTRSQHIPVEEFARELLEDLPKLMEEYPDGIMFSDLREYYGETVSRISNACKLLATDDKIVIRMARHNNARFIMPKDFTTASRFPELTVLQRKVLELFIKQCRQYQTTRVRTNYSQLSRSIECSYGGIRTCIDRLSSLGYLTIASPGLRGKQAQMVIDVKSDLILDS